MKGRIKALRKEKGLTQGQLGEVLGVSQNAVSLIEKGTNNPTVEQISKLAAYFKVSTDYIINGNENVEIIKPMDRDILKIVHNDKSIYNALVGIMNKKNHFERMAA